MNADAATLRAEFPLLAAAPELHYLDSAATAQIHRSALDAVLHHETTSRANVSRGTYRLAEAADLAFENARQTTARFLNAASADEIIFTSGATASLNLVAHAFGNTLQAGDRVLISVAEHHSNFVPWQMLHDRIGIELAFIPVRADGRLDLRHLSERMGSRCRLVALTHCSNVTGQWTDVAAVVAAAHQAGARVLLDGAQAVPHGPQDVIGRGFLCLLRPQVFRAGWYRCTLGSARVAGRDAAVSWRRRHDWRSHAIAQHLGGTAAAL